MFINNIKKIIFIVISLFMLTGCMYQNYELISSVNSSHGEDKNASKTWFEIGEKVKELSEISGIDDPVILVDGYPITKKQVEIIKIYNEFSSSVSVKEKIEQKIRAIAATAEANRMGIKSSKEDINKYIQESKNLLQTGEAVEILAYIDGMGITEEEYLQILEEDIYINYQRGHLWESVSESLEEEMMAEAEKRNVPLGDIDSEYYNKYIDELVKKADIEFLDDELKNMFLSNSK